jgi:hypothetical protein
MVPGASLSWSNRIRIRPHPKGHSSMNPVMSDLAIFVRNHEIETDARARQRVGLAREARGAKDDRGWFRRLVDGVHQFVDPRGFALAQLKEMSADVASLMPAALEDTRSRAAVAPTQVARTVELICRELEPECDERAVAA